MEVSVHKYQFQNNCFYYFSCHSSIHFVLFILNSDSFIQNSFFLPKQVQDTSVRICTPVIGEYLFIFTFLCFLYYMLTFYETITKMFRFADECSFFLYFSSFSRTEFTGRSTNSGTPRNHM